MFELHLLEVRDAYTSTETIKKNLSLYAFVLISIAFVCQRLLSLEKISHVVFS
jgi:hypothetical protein